MSSKPPTPKPRVSEQDKKSEGRFKGTNCFVVVVFVVVVFCFLMRDLQGTFGANGHLQQRQQSGPRQFK